jgi:hypothetical protein
MGKKKVQSGEIVDQALAGMRKVGGGRQPVGNSAATSARAATANTGQQKTVRKKGQSKGGATPDAGTATHRSGVGQERLGPRFALGVALPGPESVEARATQGNGRIVPAVIGSKNNFWDQARVYGSR